MPCPDCNNENVDCGCIQEALHINQICNPVNCDTEECSESFSANCIIYSGDDIICDDVTIVTAGDNIAQAVANVTAYFCTRTTTEADIVCDVDTVVLEGTSVVDALSQIVAYFCTAIDNIPAGAQGPQGDPGTNGTNGDDGNFVQVTVEAPGVNCANGGLMIEVIDGTDGITVLTTNYVCNGIDGIDGVDGQSIDHVSLTSTTGGVGSLDTYTVWGDVGETINLGTFTVQNGTNGIDANQVIVDIGAWNMDTTATVSVAHGQTFSNIRGVQVLIADDDGTFRYNLEVAQGAIQGYFEVGNTNIDLTRVAAGIFDDPSYSGTGATRGWIIINLA